MPHVQGHERRAAVGRLHGADGEEELRPPTAQCAKMDDPHLFDELLRAAERLGASVRVEAFETPAMRGGGLCVVRGETLVLIDQRAPLAERVLALARAVSELKSDIIYMAPEARELIEAIKGDRHPDVPS